MLDLDAARVGAGKVAHDPLVGRRLVEGVFGDEIQ